MDIDATEMDGACHCGAVRFHVRLKDALRSARRCSCSYCRMRGAIAVSADLDDLHILAGDEALRCYRFNTGTARHYFCGTCGIYTHHQRRSNPREYGVNVACLAGISPFDFTQVTVNDGVAHPADTGAARIAGVLRFDPAERAGP